MKTVASPASDNAASILIVDDQPGNLLTLSEILDREGFVVRQAIDGQTALHTVQINHPDLILLDIRMPEIDGYEVCSRLKANQSTQDIPVIFLSALDDALDKARAFSIGGSDYITKPFQVEEVLLRVQHQLTIRTQQQQLQELNRQLQHLNFDLERQVQTRTLELEQALAFERTLKLISDQVRDTLDQHQILRTAVEELMKVLECLCCDAVLYSPDRLTSVIRYQSAREGQMVTEGQTLYMADTPEIYDQLEHRYCFAFCQLPPTFLRKQAAVLACPIFDDQVEEVGILGDLWVFKPIWSSFSEREVHLVEQVSNQCAIALRQARLYEASQQQVQEMERLSRLKDDFLSTISHELRTPIANMKMTLELLTAITPAEQTLMEQHPQPTSSGSKVARYLEILKQECDRELRLVQDLLDLQYLEAGTLPKETTTIHLQDWLSHVVETFQSRLQAQRQRLTIEIDPGMPALLLDLSSFGRIVTELLNNACKYTPAEEMIMVSLGLCENALTLQVANTGVEIAPTELARMFDKFYRIPNNDPWKYGGTGLGLALLKRLVEQLEGEIEVISQNNVTCFTVKIPVVWRSH